MNCFNIRELQGILKRRFFVDLVNSFDHKSVLNSSMVGAKFKLNLTANLNSDTLLFYNFFLTNSVVKKNFFFNNFFFRTDERPFLFFNIFIFFNINSFYMYFFFLFNSINFAIIKYFNFVPLFNFFVSYLVSIFSIIKTFFDVIKLNFATLYLTFISGPVSTTDKYYSFYEIYSAGSLNFISNDKFSFLEKSNAQRFNRYNNSVISYDYKTGHYLGLWEQLYPQLINSFIEVARGIKKPS